MTLQLFFTLLVSVAGIAGASYGLWMVRTGRTTFGDGMEGARPPEAEVRPLPFLMIDGSGDPNVAPEYVAAVEALYGLAYALKFEVKRVSGQDYTVMPLEGLWWVDDMRQFSVRNKAAWKWTMMIMLPESVTEDTVEAVAREVERKKGLAALKQIRFERYHEGPAAQLMHIGPYAAEEPTVVKIHAYIEQHGYQLRGKHHEIYLSDPRKSAPEKMRTVVRQPFQR